MELPRDFATACGLRQRCSYCAHKYLLGDCADWWRIRPLVEAAPAPEPGGYPVVAL